MPRRRCLRDLPRSPLPGPQRPPAGARARLPRASSHPTGGRGPGCRGADASDGRHDRRSAGRRRWAGLVGPGELGRGRQSNRFSHAVARTVRCHSPSLVLGSPQWTRCAGLGLVSTPDARDLTRGRASRGGARLPVSPVCSPTPSPLPCFSPLAASHSSRPASGALLHGARPRLWRYQRAAAVVVRYDPRRPDRALLEPGRPCGRTPRWRPGRWRWARRPGCWPAGDLCRGREDGATVRLTCRAQRRAASGPEHQVVHRGEGDRVLGEGERPPLLDLPRRPNERPYRRAT